MNNFSIWSEKLLAWTIELLKDPSFMGSLIGALISGLIAICVLRSGIKHQDVLVEKAELRNFLKEAKFLSNSLSGLISSIRNYVNVQYQAESIKIRVNSNGFETEEISDMKFAKDIIRKDMEKIFVEIKSVDRKAFLSDSFDIYLMIMNRCENEIEYFGDRSMNQDVAGVADILKDSIDEINTLKIKLDEFIKESKDKYNKLQ